MHALDIHILAYVYNHSAYPFKMSIHHLYIVALFWARTDQMDLTDAMVEPVMTGGEYVGRVTVSGTLVGGRLKTVNGNIQFLGALDETNYYLASGVFEVRQILLLWILMQNVIGLYSSIHNYFCSIMNIFLQNFSRLLYYGFHYHK